MKSPKNLCWWVVQKLIKLLGLTAYYESDLVARSRRLLNQELQASYQRLASLPVMGITETSVMVGKLGIITQLGPQKIPVPVMYDYVTQETRLCLGTIYVYSAEYVRAVLRLSPQDRRVIFTKSISPLQAEHKVQLGGPAEIQLNEKEMHERLVRHGFYDLFPDAEALDSSTMRVMND